ncbi:hypothetical protein [Bartonella quintana]|uniref:Uncharacterized protein n=2 Tax=Bartonella quintana TaxID=803 RepID=W3TYT5_BARQI|nr:hypothetical protein [Bartonella quintana]ETS13251.1 hypothetical protein Q651_00204 [Bartonella quintana BQ2-D70]ETS14092.1 hypothetical protein Q650_00712 [Bartonella quintana JK 73rel]ETS15779.1 hypothetical protein Q649_00721 [Bartonella quintana JK 73]ETS17782.1 hypothetical protein Q647_00710 [Bartonella quintana JK 7]ETS18611.1 hypothetical protein Q648_00299 [Bartonella quintana JK 12]
MPWRMHVVIEGWRLGFYWLRLIYSAGQVDNAKNRVADALERVAEKLQAIAISDTGGTAKKALSFVRIFHHVFVTSLIE